MIALKTNSICKITFCSLNTIESIFLKVISIYVQYRIIETTAAWSRQVLVVLVHISSHLMVREGRGTFLWP